MLLLAELAADTTPPSWQMVVTIVAGFVVKEFFDWLREKRVAKKVDEAAVKVEEVATHAKGVAVKVEEVAVQVRESSAVSALLLKFEALEKALAEKRGPS